MSQSGATLACGGNSYLVDDLADANLVLMECSNGNEVINGGVRTDRTIKELAQLIEEVVGFNGKYSSDSSPAWAAWSWMRRKKAAAKSERRNRSRFLEKVE